MKVTKTRLWRRARYYLERLGICFRKRTLVFFEYPLPVVPPPPASLEPLRIAPISLAEFETLRYLDGWLTPREVREWLSARDCRLFGALQGADLVGSAWLELDYADLSFFDVSAHLGGKTAYLAKVSVHPCARKQGVALHLITAALEQAAREGYPRAVMCCVPENVPMFKVNDRLKCRSFQRVSYWRFLWLRRYVFRATDGRARRAAWSARFVSSHLLHWYSRLERA